MNRLKWLMLMRVILVSFLLLVTLLISLRNRDQEVVSSLTSLYLLIGYSYLLTAVSGAIFKYVKKHVWLSYFQIVGDIVFITGILQITGGIESPFVFLYFLSIISGSILYYKRGSLTAAVLSALSYMGLFYFNTAGWYWFHAGSYPVQEMTQLYYRGFLNLFSFFVIAFLSNQLAKRLEIAGEEIREKEDRIEDLQSLHENIIGSVTSGLITTGLNGRLTSVNQAARKILQMSMGDILKYGLDQLFPYPEVSEYLAKDALDQDEDSIRFETTYLNGHGDEKILGMTLSRLRNKGADFAGFLCTFQDLTRFKLLEEKMKRREQLAMIGELSAAIAHEIRNPLASMSGSIQVLRSELDLSKENRRLMDIIIKETDRLNSLIGNFLMYARPRSLECKPVGIKKLVDETITLLQNSTRMTVPVRFETEIEEDAEILVDPMAIRQVFWNLAINAVEAMPEGGTLRVTATRVQDRKLSKGEGRTGFVRVTVSDTGGGIDPAARKKLFFPFHSTKERGSGLGLAIVHQIVQQHAGWIDVVNNDPGTGAVFHLYLPEAAPSMVLNGV
ncbi:MAG: ATP-binding protein [bacterium]